MTLLIYFVEKEEDEDDEALEATRGTYETENTYL